MRQKLKLLITRLSDLVIVRIGGVALDASNILNVLKGSIHKSPLTSMITFINKKKIIDEIYFVLDVKN